MAFRPIPDLPAGISIALSRGQNIYYYLVNGGSLWLYLTVLPELKDLPKGWTIENFNLGGGVGVPPEYVGPDGTRLPIYTTSDEYYAAITEYIKRQAPAPAPAPATVSGKKRGRNNNNANTKATKYQKLNGTINVGQARLINWSETCKENRDSRHVTALIHNVESNTFLIGTENIWAQNNYRQEVGLIRFTDFMNGEQLDLYRYFEYIRSVLTSIGINRTDAFGLPHINTMLPVTEDLINDIYNRIVSSIYSSNNITKYHVKKIQKTPLACSQFIIMQKRTWGRKLGFPKGAIEQVDIVSDNEAKTIKNAAIREVREEVRSILPDPVILGTIEFSERKSYVCYFAVDNATAHNIITSFNERQINSELFDIQFVNCNYLSTNFADLNGFSQEITKHVQGTLSIDLFEGVVDPLFNRCPAMRHGGRRKRHTRKSRHNKRSKTRGRK